MRFFFTVVFYSFQFAAMFSGLNHQSQEVETVENGDSQIPNKTLRLSTNYFQIDLARAKDIHCCTLKLQYENDVDIHKDLSSR
jgi:hypothetical protein